MTDDYQAFLGKKLALAEANGFECRDVSDMAYLFPFQKDVVRWALSRGRAAIFASTGLGKTRMELEWADRVSYHTGRPVLILAPLAVAAQTVAEGEATRVRALLARDGSDIGEARIVVTNYERLHRFDPSMFGGVVLDESSCIKNYNAKTLTVLLDSFGATPFRLAATATPAPNDWIELGTHAQFLGVCKREEMLAEFFCHDGGETQVWRLKGHAQKAFWSWVASWGALIRQPSDLGYSDDAYRLPKLSVIQRTLEVDQSKVMAHTGQLFADDSATMSQRREARKASLADRVAECAAHVLADREPWIVWCDLNAEADALKLAIPDAVEVRGTDDIDTKESRLADFASGKSRVLISKPSICGWGLNWQHCARIAFVGLSDSWEAYYQAIRRCWRFGQKREVEVYVFASELEGAVVRNIERKAKDADAMGEALAMETAAAIKSMAGNKRLRVNTDHKKRMEVPPFISTRGA